MADRLPSGWMRWAAFLAAISWAAPAAAGVDDWEVNEVLVSEGGDGTAQYIELRNEAGGCLFPSSRVEVLDSSGNLVDALGLVVATTCFAPDTLRLLATTSAELSFGVSADNPLTGAIPAGTGQICFASSATKYDCVRYGSILSPVVDFFGVGDLTNAAAPPDGVSLARIDRTHVVADDWELSTPTPGDFNDGTPFDPPDAGPDAAPGPDASIADAGPDPPDAAPDPDGPGEPDARNTRYLDLEASGGADCGCGARGRAGAGDGLLALMGLLGLVFLFRRDAAKRKVHRR